MKTRGQEVEEYAIQQMTVGGMTLPAAIRWAYEQGYHEGDLDRQRILAAEIRPTRRPSRGSRGPGREGDHG